MALEGLELNLSKSKASILNASSLAKGQHGLRQVLSSPSQPWRVKIGTHHPPQYLILLQSCSASYCFTGLQIGQGE